MVVICIIIDQTSFVLAMSALARDLTGDAKCLSLGLELEVFAILDGHLPEQLQISVSALRLIRLAIQIESQTVLNVPLNCLHFPEVQNALQHAVA